MPALLTIAVIDEHPLLAEGVMQVLRAAGGYAVAGIGSTIADALDIARDKQPDIMLLEVQIAGGGLEAARHVAQLSPATKIVFLTSSECDEHITSALRDGAKGYILKGIEKSEFVRVIADIGNGRVYVNPALAARMLGRNRSQASDKRDTLSDLTNREREIITHVAQGMTNKEVAAGLRLGEKTVKHHMTSIMQKLQVRNRLEAVLMLKQVLAAGDNPAERPAAVLRSSPRRTGQIAKQGRLTQYGAQLGAASAEVQRRR